MWEGSCEAPLALGPRELSAEPGPWAFANLVGPLSPPNRLR